MQYYLEELLESSEDEQFDDEMNDIDDYSEL